MAQLQAYQKEHEFFWKRIYEKIEWDDDLKKKKEKLQ